MEHITPPSTIAPAIGHWIQNQQCRTTEKSESFARDLFEKCEKLDGVDEVQHARHASLVADDMLDGRGEARIGACCSVEYSE